MRDHSDLLEHKAPGVHQVKLANQDFAESPVYEGHQDNLVHVVAEESVDHEVPQAQLVQRVQWGPWVNVASVDPMANLVSVACLVLMADLVLQVLADLQGPKVNAAPQVLLVLLDYPENEDYQVHLELKENKDNLACLDHQVLLEDLDHPVYKVNEGRKDLQANVDCLDHVEQMDLLGNEDHVDHLDQLEFKVKLA